jgi:levansucrase
MSRLAAIYGEYYMPANAHEGAPGTIKAFRDPAYFRDPADGTEYFTFTGSLAGTDSAFNGAFGLARRDQSGWVLAPPCLHSMGVNNGLVD